jgi:3-methylfumaryl-CoA hydratase
VADAGERWQPWIGRTESVEDDISAAPVRAVLATLDDSETRLAAGDPLPPVWQWFYFLPTTPQAGLGPDGHPNRGGFMPPIEMPRRMFAGARMRFHKPLILGRPARREAVIRQVSEKPGRTGPLGFVTVAYTFLQDGAVCIEEEQDIVYREPGVPVPRPDPKPLPPLAAGVHAQTITPDPTLLFRFSALTFNAHRIHYDRPYATHVEGYPGLVVHGPLTAILLMELVRRAIARPVAAFEFRGRAPLFDLYPFRVTALPADPAGTVALEAMGPDGVVAMTATATLSSP